MNGVFVFLVVEIRESVWEKLLCCWLREKGFGNKF